MHLRVAATRTAGYLRGAFRVGALVSWRYLIVVLLFAPLLFFFRRPPLVQTPSAPAFVTPFPRFANFSLLQGMSQKEFVASSSAWKRLAEPNFMGECSASGSVPRTDYQQYLNVNTCKSISPWQFPELLPPNYLPLKYVATRFPLEEISPFGTGNECNPSWAGQPEVNEEATVFSVFIADDESGELAKQLVITGPVRGVGGTVEFPLIGGKPLPLLVQTEHRSGAVTLTRQLPDAVRKAVLDSILNNITIPKVQVKITLGRGKIERQRTVCYRPPPPRPHFLSICTFFRNDAIWLVEWLEWHFMMGVDHIFLYDHNSIDYPQLVLKPFVEAGKVTLLPWSFRPEPHDIRTYHQAQITSEHDCIFRYRSYSKYLSIIDTDEFLYPKGVFTSVPMVLRHIEMTMGFGSISWGLEIMDYVWQDAHEGNLGNRYIYEKYRRADRLLIDKYRYRRTRHKTRKSLALLAAVSQWDIHTVMSKRPGSPVRFPEGIEIMHFRVERYDHETSPDFAYVSQVADAFLAPLQQRINNGTAKGVRYYSENLIAVGKW